MHSSLQMRRRATGASAPLFVQPKLTVNAPGDRYEQEADKMADNILRMPVADSSHSRTGKNEGQLQRKSSSLGISPLSQDKNGSSAGVDPLLNNRIDSSRGGGHNLDEATQSFMSNRFGVDFSNVKIHTDNEASHMNHELNANAFTVGSDIYFNAGNYQPRSGKGQQLLAHELTHVVQQRTSHELIQKDDKETKPAESTGAKPVGANEILPYKKGERVLITNLISDFILDMAASKAGDYADILTLLRDPDIAKNLVASVSVSTPDKFEANISIPAIPAKGGQAEVGATDIVISIIRQPDGSFELGINSTGGKKIQSFISPIAASRSPNGAIILSTGAQGPKVSIGPPDAKGQRIAEAIDIPYIGSLKLVSLSSLKSESGSAAEAREIKDKTGAAKELVEDKNQEIRIGGGIQKAKQVDPVAYVGWRFTFKPLANIVQVPLTVQVEYVPKDDFLVDVSTGVQTVLPTKVPVTIRLEVGAKGGVVSDPENQEGIRKSHAVGGPTIAAGLAIPLGKTLQVEAEAKHLFDVVHKGGGSVTTYTLGLSKSF